MTNTVTRSSSSLSQIKQNSTKKPQTNNPGITPTAHNFSHCGPVLKSLNVYWAYRWSRPISVTFSDKAPVNFLNTRLETSGEKCKADPLQRDQVLPSVSDQKHQKSSCNCMLLLHSGAGGRKHIDLSPPRAREGFIIFSWHFFILLLCGLIPEGAVLQTPRNKARKLFKLSTCQNLFAKNSSCIKTL